MQKSIFGDRIDQNYASAPENQRHIQEYLSANCFGNYYTRTGLDIPTRELLTFAMLVSLGGAERNCAVTSRATSTWETTPENQRKLDAAEQLAELAEQSGLTLIQLAIAFVLRHPAVTAAIIGPRTMDHLDSQLDAAEVELTGDVLDRIDEIVPPGVNLNPADGGWVSPALEPAARRR